VTVIDDLSAGSMDNLAGSLDCKGFGFVKGDIRDLKLVRKLLKDVDVVFHQAAFVSVPLSVKDPLLTNDVNVSGTLNLLTASANANVKRFVYASSCAVYGETSSQTVSEKEQTNPASPYSASKLAAETYIKVFWKAYGLKATILRFFNIYGPRQSFAIENPYCGVITVFLNRLKKNLPLTIYGDGKQTRDFVNIKDAVEANILAMNCNRAIGEIFNVGSGKDTSINEVADILGELLHKKTFRKEYRDPWPGDIRHSCADISKAKQMLGYSPKILLKEGLEELVEWYTVKMHA
jgi:UDP-glucose 4-epimerase